MRHTIDLSGFNGIDAGYMKYLNVISNKNLAKALSDGISRYFFRPNFNHNNPLELGAIL